MTNCFFTQSLLLLNSLSPVPARFIRSGLFLCFIAFLCGIPHEAVALQEREVAADNTDPESDPSTNGTSMIEGLQAMPGAIAYNATSLPNPTPQDAVTPAAEGSTASSDSPPDSPLPQCTLDPAWSHLLQRLVSDGFDRKTVEALFSSLGPESYTPAFMAAKVMELYRAPGIGINRKKVPEPKLPDGYIMPVTDITVGTCLNFIKEHQEIFTAIEQKHGVKAPAILAILLIETGLGQDLGKDSALRALASMAATNSPERLESMGNKRQRARINPASLARTLKDKSEWAYEELKALIRYAEQHGTSPAFIPGSIYGAVGICQFMPSNVELFGIDGDQNGCIDLFSLPDAMFSVASYLEGNGWRGASTDKERYNVIRTYNNDGMYASSVLATFKRLTLAVEGKGRISPKSSALVGSYNKNPYARLDPSLRRIGHVPAPARIKSLEDYHQILLN